VDHCGSINNPRAWLYQTGDFHIWLFFPYCKFKDLCYCFPASQWHNFRSLIVHMLSTVGLLLDHPKETAIDLSPFHSFRAHMGFFWVILGLELRSLYLEPPCQPFLWRFFSRQGLTNYLLGLALNRNASWVARMTGMSHLHPASGHIDWNCSPPKVSYNQFFRTSWASLLMLIPTSYSNHAPQMLGALAF
jgi:hypothetical protein